MNLGFIGLGKMGSRMVRTLSKKQKVVATDINRSQRRKHQNVCKIVPSTTALCAAVPSPRIVWLMVPSQHVDEILSELLDNLNKGDIIVDAGNSHFKESIARASVLREEGIQYLDIGTSGGTISDNLCMMVGGPKPAYRKIVPILKRLCGKGYQHVGDTGSGHYVKMVHNAIEYGCMQSLAEGFHMMHETQLFELDTNSISKLWMEGSILQGTLLNTISKSLKKDKELKKSTEHVQDTGEARWAVHSAIEEGTSIPSLSLALMNRFDSQDTSQFRNRLLSAMRHEFGGHKK